MHLIAWVDRCDGHFTPVKTGDKACPFNSLYWNFYDKNEDKLGKNPRIGMMYNVWRKMQPEAKAALLQQADYYLKNINDL